MSKICAFTSVCLEDAWWLPQYVAEARRLEIPYVLLLDRCSPLSDARINNAICDEWCKRWFGRESESEFTEQVKQPALDAIQKLGYDWAMAWDVDETYEEAAWHKLNIANLDCFAGKFNDFDCLDTRWLNLWDDKDHVRVDGGFAAGHRVKFYNLQGARRWLFDHPITNGAKLAPAAGQLVGEEAKVGWFDLVCLHHGMMTAELRRLHKERWDRIYSTALRGDENPYKFWANAIETESQAVLIKHGYFQ